jgi:hypothetical protein
MEEGDIKQKFEMFDNNFGKDVTKEFCYFGNQRIDYIVKTDKKVIGIEAKGSRSDIQSTIGQLFFMKQVFSELYLIAPLIFIKKIIGSCKDTNFLDGVGLITISKNSLVFLKHPQNAEYYFKGRIVERKTLRQSHEEYVINENDIEIIKHFYNKEFTIFDLMNAFKLRRDNAYVRIARLKRAGVLAIVNPSDNPRAYKITEYVDTPRLRNTSN